MQCRVCGASLPPGANACPSCGSAVPASYDNSQGQLPPTAYAGPAPATNYGSGASAPPPPSYGNSPYQSGQSGSSPYNQNYPSTPYNQPGQQYPSATPYNQPANNFQQGGYPGAAGPVGPYSQPPKKSKTGLIIGIVALVLVIACVASALFANKLPGLGGTASNSTPTVTATSTSTPAGVTPTATSSNTQTNGETPSGNPIDSLASSIITNAQTAGDVDKDTLEPKAGTISTTFKVNEPIYVTFHIDPNKYDVTKEQDWVNVRFYRGNESILKDDPLQLKKEETVGYFGAQYYLATPNGAAEIYWCHTSTCSDGKLARVVHFTVTN